MNRIVKQKLVDARLYFVSLIVGLLTGLVAVPCHYLLQLFFYMRKSFFQSSPPGMSISPYSLPCGASSASSPGWSGGGLTSEAEAFRRPGARSTDVSNTNIPSASF